MAVHPSTRVDVLEVGGQGGVYQHAVALCERLSGAAITNATFDVRLHTSKHREVIESTAQYCECFDWLRDGGRLRNIRVALGFLFRTTPHVLWRRDNVVWVQGQFKLPLTFFFLLSARLLRRQTIFSPHNAFARDGRRSSEVLLRGCLRLASQVVVYNEADAQLFDSRRISASVLPLYMPYPNVDLGTRERYAWITERGFRVASIGQVRDDKNIPLLIQACEIAGLRLVVMGPDLGAGNRVKEAAKESSVEVRVLLDYFEFSELAAVMEAVDVVALPYSVASQSAVAEIARSAGAVVVAHGVGGLAAQADLTVSSLSPGDWAAVLDEALALSVNELERRTVKDDGLLETVISGRVRR